jgi:hypothetical protein
VNLNEANTNTIYIFDIDDTLIFSTSKVGYKTPEMDKFKFVSTEEYSKIRNELPKETEFDFSDFRQYDSIYFSLVNGQPNIKVLKIMDHAINSNYKIGIITARGNQKAIFKALKNTLLYRNEKDELVEIPKNIFNEKYVFAVNDSSVEKFIKTVIGKSNISDQEKKAFILKNIFKEKYGFKTIFFYDDDQSNVDSVNELNDKSIKAFKV